MEGSNRSYGEHAVEEKKKQERYEWRSRVKECVEACNIELARGENENYLHVANILHDYLFPLVVESDRTDSLDHYHMELIDSDDHEWWWTPVNTFLDRYDEYYAALSAGETADAIERHLMKKQGALPITEAARRRTERAFRSVESICEYEGIISNNMSSSADAYGFSLRLGRHLQKYEMDLGDEVRIVTDDSGLLKTLFCGDTGQGKSAIEEHEAYDRYCAGMKYIDLVDMDKYENVVHDLPQQQDDLRRIRREAGVPVDITESDDLPEPEIEILLPLTPGLEDEELSFNTDADEFVPRPFTIPASNIPKDVMVSLIVEDLSKQQKTTIKHAYEAVDKERDDWTLGDLAEEVRQRDDLDEAYVKRAVNTLESLQSVGFIRSKDCPYALDLEEVMRDTRTITVFSQRPVKTETGRLMVVAWMIDQVYNLRREVHDLPKLALVLRELHEIVPHTRRAASDDQAEALQKFCARRMSKLMRKNRFYGVELLCDTQFPSDVQKGVRDGFSRAVAFDLPAADLELLFEVTPSDKRAFESCRRTNNQKSGQASIIGRSEPAVHRDNIEFISPVELLPSPTHHFDADKDDAPETGFHARAKYLDNEEIRRPCDVDGVEWDGEYESDIEIDTEQLEPDEYEPEKNPMGAFVQEFIEPAGDDEYEYTKDVRDAYAEYAETLDLPPKHENTRRFGSELEKYAPLTRKGSEERLAYPKNGEQAYWGISLKDGSE